MQGQGLGDDAGDAAQVRRLTVEYAIVRETRAMADEIAGPSHAYDCGGEHHPDREQGPDDRLHPRIARSMANTLTAPEPMPSMPEIVPARAMRQNPSGTP
jgi:hypothetical protein